MPASDYESVLLETWQRKPDAIPVLLSDNLRKEREIAALREQLATTASDGEQTLTLLLNAQNGALLAEVERLTGQVAALREALALARGLLDTATPLPEPGSFAAGVIQQLDAALATAGGEGQRAGDNDRG
mgnify:CR=1 FL=1